MRKSVLISQFERLESSKNDLLAALEKLEAAVLHHKPAPGKWSIIQILYHLNIAESSSVNYVKKKMLAGKELKNSGLTAAFRSTLLKWMLISGYKWKAPKILGEVPEEIKYEEVTRLWNENRNQLRNLIDSIPDHLIGKEIYRHPRAGRLNLSHMLSFFQHHFDHHLPQVERLKRKNA